MIRSATLALLLLGASVCTTGAPVPIYENEPWYRQSPEPEREWRGTLERRTVVEGPMARTALRYELATVEARIPVYAPTDALDRYAGKSITVRGKLVEVEGTKELWVGAVR